MVLVRVFLVVLGLLDIPWCVMVFLILRKGLLGAANLCMMTTGYPGGTGVANTFGTLLPLLRPAPFGQGQAGVQYGSFSVCRRIFMAVPRVLVCM